MRSGKAFDLAGGRAEDPDLGARGGQGGRDARRAPRCPRSRASRLASSAWAQPGAPACGGAARRGKGGKSAVERASMGEQGVRPGAGRRAERRCSRKRACAGSRPRGRGWRARRRSRRCSRCTPCGAGRRARGRSAGGRGRRRGGWPSPPGRGLSRRRSCSLARGEARIARRGGWAREGWSGRAEAGSGRRGAPPRGGHQWPFRRRGSGRRWPVASRPRGGRTSLLGGAGFEDGPVDHGASLLQRALAREIRGSDEAGLVRARRWRGTLTAATTARSSRVRLQIAPDGSPAPWTTKGKDVERTAASPLASTRRPRMKARSPAARCLAPRSGRAEWSRLVAGAEPSPQAGGGRFGSVPLACHPRCPCQEAM